ncbi:MAG TPA: hypothetical protein VNJ28_08195 [Candidatus Limnocylindrales bacterium]|nr:hypothetical protein [Candidatus Limnocylindrales bacterium]
MIHPTDDRRAVREGRLAAVTCAACGCRLQAGSDGRWRHFAPMAGRDARGCRIACADLAHDESGRVVAVADVA